MSAREGLLAPAFYALRVVNVIPEIGISALQGGVEVDVQSVSPGPIMAIEGRPGMAVSVGRTSLTVFSRWGMRPRKTAYG
jgi:hypothetical protein